MPGSESPRRGSGTEFCKRIGSGYDGVVCGVELVHDGLDVGVRVAPVG